MGNKILPEFQEFLVIRHLAPQKNILFFALWAHKFLSFCNNMEDDNKPNIDVSISRFILHLRNSGQNADWQISQTENSIKLYVYNYLKGDVSSIFPDNSDNLPKRKVSIDDIVKQTREIIRVKHYSYRTEQCYIDWIKRYFVYLTEIKGKDLDIPELDSSDYRDYSPLDILMQDSAGLESDKHEKPGCRH